MKTETVLGGSGETLLVELVDEFTVRLDRGEQPRIDDYAARYPAMAETLRQVLPAVAAVRSLSGGLGPQVECAETTASINGRLGDYRIVREIGRGGMGIVYEAQQISLGRRVALKVLPFAAVLDPRKLQRFKTEAQAAAQLHHTNIVPVFSVGCERGVHYYAMQYIEGQSLAAVVGELRGLAGLDATESSSPPPEVDRSGCGPARVAPSAAGSSGVWQVFATRQGTSSPAFFRSVAKLGIQAAEALDHAHVSGVVHRDIKPSNLLLDARGNLWIADFGLALIESDPGLTMTGDILGTIRYMSPEQALAKRVPMDHRTDIYSLGVTLYEVLTLQPAFSGRERQELLRQIAFEEPKPLRRLNRTIPLELETIVLKAISKNANDRYDTALQLANDLERFLADRPIWAKPPSVARRAAQWCRRHRTVVTSSVLLLVMAVAALSVSTVLIWRERAEAIRQRNAAQAQHARAEANFGLARDSLDRMLTRVANAELGGEPQMAKVRRALLEDALQFHEQFFQQKADDPTVRAEVGEAYTRVGHINALLGQPAQAEEAYRGAIDVYRQLRVDFPSVTAYQAELANGHAALATMLWETGSFARAEPPAREALSVVRELTAAFPADPRYRGQLARSCNLLGLILGDLRRVDEAEAALRECIAVREELAADLPETPELRLELARSLRNLAHLLMTAERGAEAAAVVREAMGLQDRLVAEFPDSLDYGAELAHTKRWWEEMQATGTRRLASEDTRRASPLWRATLEQLPAVPWYGERLARSYHGLYSALQRTGRPREAEGAHQRAVELQEKLVASFPETAEYRVELVQLHLAHARAMKLSWRADQAEAALREALHVQAQLSADFPREVEYRQQLAALRGELDELRSRGDVGELVAAGKRSPEGVAEAVVRARLTDVNTAGMEPFTRLVISEYRMLSGDYEAAAAAIQRALDEGAGRTSQREGFYKSLGWALLGCGRTQEAQAAFEHTLDRVRGRNAQTLRNECPDPWTAAYFLDRVSLEEYTQRWQHDVLCGRSLACFPWFYVGLRMELAGRTEDARAAYVQCVELGRRPNAHHTANWAAYRLGLLTEPQK